MALGKNPRAEEMTGRRHAATGSVAEDPSRITNLVPVPNIIYHILSIYSSGMARATVHLGYSSVQIKMLCDKSQHE